MSNYVYLYKKGLKMIEINAAKAKHKTIDETSDSEFSDD
jgi:hypothetical protein